MTNYIAPQQKIYQHLDRLADIKAGKRPAPVNVEIDLSNRCSHGCQWCHFAYTHTRGPLASGNKIDGRIPGGDLMDAQLANDIVSQLAQYGVRSIVWSGGGEPTLHPGFNQIVTFTKRYWNLDQGLYTHGSHINEERAAVLKKHMTWIYVSLDRHTAESFKTYKGVDRFDEVCKGIQLLASADGKATVGVGFLLDRHSWMDAPDMYALGMSLGADYVQFRPIIQYSHERPGELVEDTAWVTNAMRVLSGLKDKPGVEVDLDRFAMYRDWQGHGYKSCYWSSLSTVITPNGKVWTCCNTREYPGHELGDLSKERFEDIWQRVKGPAAVNGTCRTLCRGHIANLALNEIMTDRQHGNFI